MLSNFSWVSFVFGALFAYFLLPYVMGMFARATNKSAT